MYKEALQVQRDLGDERLQANCLVDIGAVYFEKAQFEDARTYYQQALQLQEKAKVPADLVLTVNNLADTSVRMGQYDQAVSLYMRALELWRSMNDARGAAITSYTLGVMFDYQGRYGAAIESKQTAFKTFQELKEKTTLTAEITGSYGESLILAGRGNEAKTPLNDALNLARELKNDSMVSLVLVFHGDAAYYAGDFKSARAFYEQALAAGARSKEPERILLAKVGLAEIAAREGPLQQAINNLRQLALQADELGLQNVSVACSLSIAEAMIRNHDNSHAQEELERALVRADKIGLKPLSANAHYLLGNALRASGNDTEAQRHYRDTIQLLDGMRREAGADKLLERADLKTMYEEATRWSQAGKG
jgi:tetratricopeptide (TPR) repeat protein